MGTRTLNSETPSTGEQQDQIHGLVEERQRDWPESKWALLRPVPHWEEPKRQAPRRGPRNLQGTAISGVLFPLLACSPFQRLPWTPQVLLFLQRPRPCLDARSASRVALTGWLKGGGGGGGPSEHPHSCSLCRGAHALPPPGRGSRPRPHFKDEETGLSDPTATGHTVARCT